MKHIYLFLFAFCMLLTACGATPSNPTMTAVQMTVTFPVTETSAPSAATETPIATPTRQPSRTPSAPQTCPQTDEKTRANFAPAFKGKKVAYHDARQVVLDFLNAGGNPQTAIDKLAENGVTASLLDVTGDGVPELLLPSGYLSIFGCADGKYVSLLDLAPTEGTGYEPVTLNIQDLNQNGVPEIFLAQVLDDRVRYSLLEWDGKHLVSIVQESYQSSAKLYIENHDIYAVGQGNDQKGAINGNWQLVDIDNDGLKEIAIKAGVTSKFIFNADLEEQIILKSTGGDYQVASFSKEFTPTPKPTHTPLPFSATCDYKAPDVHYQYPEPFDFDLIEDSVTKFLDAGGDPHELSKYYSITIKDLTNDGVPEIVAITNFEISSVYIFSCVDGAYKNTIDETLEQAVNNVKVLSTDDLNKNGIPEITLRGSNCFLNHCGYLFVGEWNGNKFVGLIKGEDGNYIDLAFPQDVYLKDLDGDGIKELVWVGEKPDPLADQYGLPWRIATHIYKWDGKNYVSQIVEYGQPTYRFQAVQDGDRYALAGIWDKAIKSYREAIENGKLDWWSEGRQQYFLNHQGLDSCNGTQCPLPEMDKDEKPILQAYATYRLMLAQLMMQQSDAATKTYNTLLATYSSDSPAYSVVQMATTFWDEYQKSQSIGNACAKAIKFVNGDSRFLAYIGSGYHGWQMQTYKPEDVCPFK